MLKKLSFLILITVSISCVYYNTFYNAKLNFKKAEQNQLRSIKKQKTDEGDDQNRASQLYEPTISINDKTFYKSAIDKANKVVMYHPKSKYVDDALWIIGKSRYNMTEYISSDKKFRELIIRFPESGYVDDAYYYIGMGKFWLKKYDEALEAFDKLMNMKKSPYHDDAFFIIAYIDFICRNYSSAIPLFENLLKTYSGSDSTAIAQYFIGACYDSLAENVKALQAYKDVDKFNPSHELYYEAQFAYGSASLRADSLKLGMTIFEDIAKQERYFEKLSKIRLKLAEGKQLMGLTDEAIAEYLDIIDKFPKTHQSAEAYYRLGIIYQNTKIDLETAKQYYNDATKEKRKSLYYNLALAKSAQISKLESYRRQLGRTLPEDNESADTLVESSEKEQVALEDSTVLDESENIPDSVDSETESQAIDDENKGGILNPTYEDILKRMAGKNEATADSLFPDSLTMTEPHDTNSQDLAAQKDDVDSDLLFHDSLTMTEPHDTNSQNLAIQKDDVDTDSLESNPDSVLAEIDKQDSLSQTVTESPDTISTEKDAEIRFLLAELYQHDLELPDSALNEYLLLADTYPGSDYASRALLAAAFIYEQKDDRTNALKLYMRIINFFPSSEQAQYAVKQVEGISIPHDKNIYGLYCQAEDMYYVYNNPDSAIVLFDYIEKTFPESEYAIKSAFSKAWLMSLGITEDGDSSAYYEFASIIDKYPETPYAEKAKMTMGLVKKKTAQKPAVQNEEKQEKIHDTQRDSLQQAIVDSLRKIAQTLPTAPAVKDTGEFIYPESLVDSKRRGMVTYKIKLDLFGNIIDHQMLGPSGNEIIDSLATRALLNTTFEMSDLEDLSLLDDYFRYDVRFEPPDPDEFFNRAYRER